MAEPIFDWRADRHQRRRQVHDLLELVVEGDEVIVAVPYADPLVHTFHRLFQEFPLPFDFRLRPLALGDVGGDADGAALGRRRDVELERPSAAGDRSLVAYGFAPPLVADDRLFDQVVLGAGAEVAALGLIARHVVGRPAHLD